MISLSTAVSQFTDFISARIEKVESKQFDSYLSCSRVLYHCVFTSNWYRLKREDVCCFNMSAPHQDSRQNKKERGSLILLCRTTCVPVRSK